MIVKGIVSAVYEDQKKLSVILPEYNNMTTPPLQIYGTPNMSSYNINDFVLVVVFNNDFSDAVILAETTSNSDENGSESSGAYKPQLTAEAITSFGLNTSAEVETDA